MSEVAVCYLLMLGMVPRQPQSITAPELARRLADEGFKVSVRSVQRDLEKLCAFFPLQVDEDTRPFRWYFGREAVLNTIPAMDSATALTFELARAYLRPVLPQRTLAKLQPHFDIAQQAVQRQRQLAKWPDRVRVINRGLSSRRPEIDAEVLETVTESLLRECQCGLLYQARQWPQPEQITVHPYGLVFRDPNIYLIGRIEGREGMRQLVLHRIHDSHLTDEPVTPQENFNLDDYIGTGNMGLLFSDEPIRVRLRCDKPVLNHLWESPLGEDQVTTDLDDRSFEVTVTIADTQDLRWWLIAQARHLDILEPQWLRDEIQSELEVALRRTAASRPGKQTARSALTNAQ